MSSCEQFKLFYLDNNNANSNCILLTVAVPVFIAYYMLGIIPKSLTHISVLMVSLRKELYYCRLFLMRNLRCRDEANQSFPGACAFIPSKYLHLVTLLPLALNYSAPKWCSHEDNTICSNKKQSYGNNWILTTLILASLPMKIEGWSKEHRELAIKAHLLSNSKKNEQSRCWAHWCDSCLSHLTEICVTIMQNEGKQCYWRQLNEKGKVRKCVLIIY